MLVNGGSVQTLNEEYNLASASDFSDETVFRTFIANGKPDGYEGDMTNQQSFLLHLQDYIYLFLY